MHATSDTARQCIELALTAAPAMVGHAVDQAVAALQAEEQRSQSVAQRQELADAWLELTRRRAHWTGRFAPLLRAAQAARPTQPETRATAAVVDSNDRFGGLTLLDEDTLATEIESARVLQLLAPKLEQPLTELDGLMSTALGLERVQPEANPLRPQVFAQALRELMQPVPVPAWSKVWTQHLAGPLANEVANLYRDAIKLLRAAHLTEASYRVLPPAPGAPKPATPADKPADRSANTGNGVAGPAGGAGHAGAPGASTGQAFPHDMSTSSSGAPGDPRGEPAAPGLVNTGPLGGAAWADLSSYSLGDELFQAFLFSRTPPSTKPLAPAYYAKVDAQMAEAASPEQFQPYDADEVAQLRALSPVERPHRSVGTTRALDNAVWGRWAAAQERALHRTRLKKEARQVGQVLGLEVVRQLVDQVARDPRLLAPVREAIVALEPSLAKLALVTPRFFAEEDHAGRRLVERVAERSFRYNDEFASDFQEFFADIRTTFRSLNEQPVEDLAPFAQALQELEERWAGEDALEDRGGQVAVDAVHFAEARAAEAAQIAWSLSQRSDLDGVPAVVQDFLFGPWSQVMAHARLTDGSRHPDPGGWNSVITDLLWSTKTDHTLRDPARLFTTVPAMLVRLRDGMKLIGCEPSQSETFFQALEQLHRPVLKLRARTRKASHGPEAGPALDPALMNTQRQQPRAPGELWLTPSELQQAGFEDSQQSGPVPLAPEEEGQPQTATIIAGLQQGCWVDLHSRGRWRRANLKWVNERATLFMFTSHGGQPHSMTRRSLERLVRERHLRPVEQGGVVPRALEQLAQPAAPAAGAPRARAVLEESLVA